MAQSCVVNVKKKESTPIIYNTIFNNYLMKRNYTEEGLFYLVITQIRKGKNTYDTNFEDVKNLIRGYVEEQAISFGEFIIETENKPVGDYTIKELYNLFNKSKDENIQKK